MDTNSDTEKLMESLSETKKQLEAYRSKGQVVVGAIDSLDRLEEFVADPTGGNVRDAIKIARELNEEVETLKDFAPSIEGTIAQTFQWLEERFMEEAHVVEGRVEMTPVEAEGFILDIGGGGEGIIGRLNGRDVVAIDLSIRELEETENESLKLVMDAADLKFLPSSFAATTSFFTLLYVDREKQEKVFSEVHRVLEEGGRFLIWDVAIPERVEGKSFFLVRLEITLPDEKVDAGYGVSLVHQDIEYFKGLAGKTGFKVADEWCRGELFHLELVKG